MNILDYFIIAGFALPCVLALFLSKWSQSKIARLILRWGGCLFGVLFIIELLPLFLCSGNILYGYNQCSGGPLAIIAYQNYPSWVLVGALAYAFVGPVLLALAAVCEMIVRRRLTKNVSL